MKAVARDFRDFVVHTDVITDYVRRQTTSGSTDPDKAVVLENRTSVSGYQNYPRRSTITEKHSSDSLLSRDRNWNWKSTTIGTCNADNDSAINNVLELLPETNETAAALSNHLVDSSNHITMYNDSTKTNFTEDNLLCGIPVLGTTTSAGNRMRPRRMVTSATQTTETAKQSASRNATVHEAASCVRRGTEVIRAVAMPRDAETTGSDQSTYSGVYERDLEEILESLEEVKCRIRHRRRRCISAAFASSHQRADKFYFRLPRSSEVQSYRSSSDSCYGRSDSDSEPERSWTPEDDLNSDEDATDGSESGSFFRRLNRFLLSGNWGPDMTAIEP